MHKLGIIGLAIVAATAFGVWSADTVANSKVAKAEVAAAFWLLQFAASEPLVIRPPRSSRLAPAFARRSAVRCTARRSLKYSGALR